MKLVSPEEHARIERLRQQRERKRLLRQHKAIRKISRLRRIRARHAERKSTAQVPRNHIRLVLPPEISFRTNYDDIVQLLEDLRDVVFNHHAPVFLDFSQVRKISPAATLVLVAEVFRCRHLAPTFRVNGNYPNDPVIGQQLKDMGFYPLIKVNNPPAASQKPMPPPQVEYIKFFTSNNVRASLAKQLRLALTKGASAIRVEARHRMFEGLKEAMNNAIQHAYLRSVKPRFPQMRDRWWMAGAIDRRNNELMVMFFDQGVGIPRTLPRRHPKTFKIVQRLLRLDDGPSARIKIAIRLGESSTGQSFRGKGLHDVREFVTLCREGQLRILSGSGEYVYNADGRDKLTDHPRSIGGTLIQWRVSQSSLVEASVGT